MKASRITKIAGLSVAGFVVTSIVADKANLSPLVSQVAGFAGAFLGTIIGGRRHKGGVASEASRQVDAAAAPTTSGERSD